jgi:hypothetical protein
MYSLKNDNLLYIKTITTSSRPAQELQAPKRTPALLALLSNTPRLLKLRQQGRSTAALAQLPLTIVGTYAQPAMQRRSALKLSVSGVRVHALTNSSIT